MPKTKFEPVNKQLKNGKTVTIRECVSTDAEQVLQMAKSYYSDSEHLMLSKNEFNPTTEQELKWIESFHEKENSLLLVATYEGKIIGNIDLTEGKPSKIRHTAFIGVAMLKEWRNQGLGKALMECIISWAQSNKQLELLWLKVFASNAAGIALYKKMGFSESGRLKDFVKTADGVYIDDLTLQLKVK